MSQYTFLSIMFFNKNHRSYSESDYNDYYNSIFKLDNVMKLHNNMYLFCDKQSYETLKGLKQIKYIRYKYSCINKYKYI